jgi:hypothetical protein
MALRPVTESAAWRGKDLSGSTDWIAAIDTDIQHELEDLAERARARGMTCDNLEIDGEPGPALARMIAAIQHALQFGRGFILLRGLKIDDRPEADIGMLYSALGACLGVAVSQSADGDRLGHVIDRGLGDQGRYYTRGGQLEFHMDPVDVVGLLCLRSAMTGGASRIVSALEVHNTILQERPDLMAVLHRGFHNARRPEGLPPTPHRVPIFNDSESGVECYYLPVTIRQAADEGFPLQAEEREALAYLAEVAGRPALRLDMDMREGDIQFLNNRKILHARTDYVDHPDRKLWRHLLRLWLMMPHWPVRSAAMKVHSGDRSGGGVRPRAPAG